MLRANMTVKIESDGILLDNTSGTGAAYFGQPFENVSDLNGETLTLSFLTNDNLYTSTSVLNTTITDWQLVSGLSNEYRVFIAPTGASTGQTNPIVCWQIYPGASVKLKGVKLELGDHQTLAEQNEDGEWEIIDPPDYDLQYALCSLYSPTTGEWIGYQHSNPNLLDNWYFSDPINQRRLMEYEGSTYTIDRWRMWVAGMKTTLASGGLVIQNGSGELNSLVSYSETQTALSGKTVTVSALSADGKLSVGTGQYGTLITANTVDDTWFIQAYKSGNNYAIVIWVNPGKTTTPISAVKLELGPVQTLARQDVDGNWVLNDPPPNRALELAKCQRYQVFGEMCATYVAKQGTAYRCFLPLPVTLRGNPTVIGTPSLYAVSTNSPINGDTVSVHSAIENGVFLTVSGATEPVYVWFPNSSGLDAN